MTPALDPVQLGQTLGAVVMVGVTCVAAIRQGLGRWKRGQDDAQRKEKRAMRNTVRAELVKVMATFQARLDGVERAISTLQKPGQPAVEVHARRRARVPKPRK